MPRARATRRQRAHGVLPAGFKWRDGRPRWEPSPSRRKAGWKALDLKDAYGAWMPRGAAIERAELIAKAVAGWAAGEPAPPAFIHIAPKGAAAGGRQLGALSPRSIGALVDAFCEAEAPRRRKLSDKTRADYRSKLKVLLEEIAASQSIAVEALRAIDISLLLQPPEGSNKPFLLDQAYDDLCERRGETMGHGALAVASSWLAWVQKKKRAIPYNPAQLVERREVAGRIVVFTWPELLALVAAAEELGWFSIADAVILAVDLSWSQQDLLAFMWRQISDDGHCKHRRIKTGVAGNPRLLKIGEARVKAIRARWEGEKVRPTHVLVCERTRQPWAASDFRHRFAEIRALAASKVNDPESELATKQFRDLRDTAITIAYDGGLSIEEICTRSLHDPKRAREVISKHYGALTQGLADGAADKLGAHFTKMGYGFGE
jgi:hypothetical protein